MTRNVWIRLAFCGWLGTLAVGELPGQESSHANSAGPEFHFQPSTSDECPNGWLKSEVRVPPPSQRHVSAASELVRLAVPQSPSPSIQSAESLPAASIRLADRDRLLAELLAMAPESIRAELIARALAFPPTGGTESPVASGSNSAHPLIPSSIAHLWNLERQQNGILESLQRLDRQAERMGRQLDLLEHQLAGTVRNGVTFETPSFFRERAERTGAHAGQSSATHRDPTSRMITETQSTAIGQLEMELDQVRAQLRSIIEAFPKPQSAPSEPGPTTAQRPLPLLPR